MIAERSRIIKAYPRLLRKETSLHARALQYISVSKRAARNPQTGETIRIRAKESSRFKASKDYLVIYKMLNELKSPESPGFCF